MNDRLWVAIPAGGSGSRMASSVAKQYLPLAGKTVLEHTLAVFSGSRFSGVAVALAADDNLGQEILSSFGPKALVAVGGSERSDSVANALETLAEQGANDNDWVLVHDAARPCLPVADLNKLIAALDGDEIGGLLAVPVRDTLKSSRDGQHADKTVDRSPLWQALTPQMFRLGLLRKALAHCADNHLPVTDEASAIEQLGHKPKLVAASPVNLKITWPEDIALAEKLLELLK